MSLGVVVSVSAADIRGQGDGLGTRTHGEVSGTGVGETGSEVPRGSSDTDGDKIES